MSTTDNGQGAPMEYVRGEYEDFFIPKEIFQSESLAIVDVRTEEEYFFGHIDESINIPLQELPYNYEHLHQFQHVVVICKSGIRSEYAKEFLKEAGFQRVYNGGGWDAFEKILKENTQGN
jgi:rhodanese-related sulfurtransferase